jgi:malate synthase
VEALVTTPAKAPWYIDLLNLTLDNYDRAECARRVALYLAELRAPGTRVTRNLEFDAPT